MPMMTLREIRNEPIPERALDAFLAKLDGWNLDWSDPAEIENLGVPHYKRRARRCRFCCGTGWRDGSRRPAPSSQRSHSNS